MKGRYVVALNLFILLWGLRWMAGVEIFARNQANAAYMLITLIVSFIIWVICRTVPD